MQYNFQEGLLCGLLLSHGSDSNNSNKNYRPLNDPLFKYILDNYTPKVEIIMTPHYTYKYYYDLKPFFSDDDILIWTNENNGFGIELSYGTVSIGNKSGYVRIHDFHKAIGSKQTEPFSLDVWYRDGVPIIGYLGNGSLSYALCENYPDFHTNYYKTVDGKRVYLDQCCYPRYAIKDLKITQSAPIGVLEQKYYVSYGEIKKRGITLPEGAVNPPTITVSYKKGTNKLYPSNYDLLYDENGNLIPNSPEPDWSRNPIVIPSSFEDITYNNRGAVISTAPDFTINYSGGNTNSVFCEMTPDEFHECELELINQQYEKAYETGNSNYKYRVKDIPSFLLPKGFTNKDLPPELNRMLPKT